jgi:hypothetical protein
MNKLILLPFQQISNRDTCRLRNDSGDVIARYPIMQHTAQLSLVFQFLVLGLPFVRQLTLQLWDSAEAKLGCFFILTETLGDF